VPKVQFKVLRVRKELDFSLDQQVLKVEFKGLKVIQERKEHKGLKVLRVLL
jgi:hypothetical protein